MIVDAKKGNCFAETNVHYISNNIEDDFAHYFTYSFEKCCSDCNRLSICLSWTYIQESQTCQLKKTFRPNPTLEKGFVSGFKPSELFSLSITRGLMFTNVYNPIYDQLVNATTSPNSSEANFYNFLKSDLESQVDYLKFYFLFFFVFFNFRTSDLCTMFQRLIRSKYNFKHII